MRNLIFLLIVIVSINATTAKGRKGSKRIGGYNSHGKGSHYIGGRR